MAARALLGLLGLLVFQVACEGREPTHFQVQVRVHSDPGEGVGEVRLSSTGGLLGVTDAGGSARLTLAGKPGESIDLRIECPPGFQSPDEPLRVVLRRWVRNDRVPSYEARCAPTTRRVVVAVRTENAGSLPLRYLGETIARTTTQGAGHALLEVPPGETVRLTLDTSEPEHKRLRPRNPELTLTVPDRDEVVVFDQRFTLTPKPKSKVRKRRRKRRGPVRI